MKGDFYCEYAGQLCQEDFFENNVYRGFFIYPSHPVTLAQTVKNAVKELQEHSSIKNWETWEDLNVGGQLIFCKICKAIRASNLIVANITHLNFNVLFELGFAIGLQKAVLPLRDTSYSQSTNIFNEIGIFDVLGYESFKNSKELRSAVTKERAPLPIPIKKPEININQPIYYIKSPIDTDGSIRLLSMLKKSYLHFRTFDSRETPRLSLHEAYKQVFCSSGIIGYLLDPGRDEAQKHNALVAFVCGMGLAAGKHILMIQEGYCSEPIDYRDLSVPYTEVSSINRYVVSFVKKTADTTFSKRNLSFSIPTGLLEKIDIGDTAAENEIQALPRYFVKTPEYQQTSQGHVRLVVGRKGAGKTAIFYAVRQKMSENKKRIVLDLKPEGHQLLKFKEAVLKNLSKGFQEHLLTAFWNYLLLLELGKKIYDKEEKDAYRDPESKEKFENFSRVIKAHIDVNEEIDFSERLLNLVEKVITAFEKAPSITNSNITNIIYQKEVNVLEDVISQYLEEYQLVRILFDNIDKSLPAKGASEEDIAYIRCLLQATRKLENTFVRRHIDFKSIVFLRTDIYNLVEDYTSDRGKDTVVYLEWSDPILFKELLRLRFVDMEGLSGSFDDVWLRLFDSHVRGEDSFRYIMERTLQRPRDLLNFVRKSIQTAISHNHLKVEEDDILMSEKQFSADMLKEIKYEIRDVHPEYPEIINSFFGQSSYLSYEELGVILLEAGISEEKMQTVIDILLWFSFIGISWGEEERYSYQVQYDLNKIKSIIKNNNCVYIIHPAFRNAIEVAK